MMILPIQEAYRRKFGRQKKIQELEYHAAGHCAHIGKLSPGCYGCFVPSPYRMNIFTGEKCNLNCPYCSGKHGKAPNRKDRIIFGKGYLIISRLKTFEPMSISFSGGGEPLLYMDIIDEYMRYFKEIERHSGKRPWYYLYTNGLFANSENLKKLQDLGFDEIRFHLGASNFSKQSYRNLKKATKCFKTISVETPAWPLHRKKLFEMLPVIEDTGVKHLNLGEVEINPYNREHIAKIFPEGEIYQCNGINLYDGGLVYDIIEEVVKRKYSYSVLDCNCFVKSIQRGPGKYVFHEGVKGLVAED
jgi:pyruvate formate-lyase activating enzyme-like uncharacterized protein